MLYYWSNAIHYPDSATTPTVVMWLECVFVCLFVFLQTISQKPMQL